MPENIETGALISELLDYVGDDTKSVIAVELEKRILAGKDDDKLNIDSTNITLQAIAWLSDTYTIAIDTEIWLSGYLKDLFNNSESFDSYIESILLINSKIPRVRAAVIHQCYEILQLHAYNRENLVRWPENLGSESSGTAVQYSSETVANCLRFVYKDLLKSVEAEFSKNFLISLALLLLAKNTDISKLSSKCLTLALRGLTFNEDNYKMYCSCWPIIESLVQGSQSFQKSEEHSNHQETLGYIFWMQWISPYVIDSSNAKQFIQTCFDQDSFWKLVQKGLAGSYDQRKYSLTILSRCLQQIDHDISQSKYMAWDVEKSAEYLQQWSLYITLVEILSIDTSLHQTMDSYKDIQYILSEESVIPSEWGLFLLYLGLDSSTEAIRKFVVNSILDIPSSNMMVFREDGEMFIAKKFLPCCMQASYFLVSKADKEICIHGERLTRFLSDLLRSIDDEQTVIMVGNILSLLYEMRYTFDPSRIYVMRGLASGLQGRNVLGQSELGLLKSLLVSTTETKLREETIFVLYTSILFSVDATKVSVKEWIHIWVCIFKCNTGLFSWRLPLIGLFIRNAPSTASWSQQLESNDEDYTDLLSDTSISDLSPYLVHCEIYSHLFLSCPPSILQLCSNLELLSYFVSSDLQACGSLFVSSTKDIWDRFAAKFVQLYEDVDNFNDKNLAILRRCLMNKSVGELIEDKTILNSVDILWKSTVYAESLPNIEIRAMSFEIVAISIETILKWPDNIEISDLKAQMQNLFSPQVRAQKALQASADKLLAAIYKILRLRILIEMLSGSLPVHFHVTIPPIIQILQDQFPSAGYHARLEMVKFLQEIIDNKQYVSDNGDVLITTLQDLLPSMWNSLVDDRLSVSQKELHHAYLNLAFSPLIVQQDKLSATLELIAEGAIEQSFARRGLLPVLCQNLYQFCKESLKYDMEIPEWIGRILLHAFTFIQIDDHLFKLEAVIGHMLDELRTEANEQEKQQLIQHKEDKEDQKSSSYLDTYQCLEVASKVFAISSIAFQPPSLTLAKSLIHHMYDSERYNIRLPIKRNDGNEEKVRIGCYQFLLVLEPYLDTQIAEELLKDKLMTCLRTEPSPTVRAYIEWIIARLIVRLEDQWKMRVLQTLDNFDETPQVIISYQRIGILIARYLRSVNSNYADFYRRFINKIIAYATSNKATIRHFSVSIACALDNEFEGSSDQLTDSLRDLVPIIQGISRQAMGTSAAKSFRSGEYSLWDISKDFSLCGICGGVLSKISDKNMQVISEETFRIYLGDSITDISLPLGHDSPQWIPEEHEDEKTLDTVNANNASLAPVQTKSRFWSDLVDIASEDGREGEKVERGELILVASLVDKPPNLGGICRLSDVLGVGLLCINDMSVTNHGQFKSVAVTADQWMPMQQVKEKDIEDFMMVKKKAGYTLIGLEQTDQSVVLDRDLEFPAKSLILLGKEREGIPGYLLAELDFCVEIKQVGVIRSMNIQTATAVVVHSYSVQHCK